TGRSQTQLYVHQQHSYRRFLFDGFDGTINDVPGYVEGSCVSDPCWFCILVLALFAYPFLFFLSPRITATNVVAKKVFAKTETGAPVAVMCNSTMVMNDVGFQCVDGPFVPTAAGLGRA
ncbi:hypothetical protein K435DRAFT_886034, partial [Dendrothele bispora CBS 962.96]